MVKKSLFILAILALFTISAQAVNVGETIPDFELKDLQGNKVKISDFRGQYVLFDVWATWCGPCINALKAYRENIEKFEEVDIKIVAISTDRTLEIARKYIEENEMPFLILHTDAKVTMSQWGVRGIPAMFLVNSDGKVITKETGFGDFQRLWDKISRFVDTGNVKTKAAPVLKTGEYKAEIVNLDHTKIEDLLYHIKYKSNEFSPIPLTQLTKEPKYPGIPLYGVINGYYNHIPIVAVDSDNSGTLDKLYIDFNDNGDLTDDGPPLNYTEESTHSIIEIVIEVDYNTETRPVYVCSLSLPQGSGYFYFMNFGYEAKIDSDQGPIKVILLDANANEHFYDDEDILFLDVGQNGLFDSHSEFRENVFLGISYDLGDFSYTFSFDYNNQNISVKRLQYND